MAELHWEARRRANAILRRNESLAKLSENKPTTAQEIQVAKITQTENEKTRPKTTATTTKVCYGYPTQRSINTSTQHEKDDALEKLHKSQMEAYKKHQKKYSAKLPNRYNTTDFLMLR